MRMPVLKIALTGLASVALGSAAVAGGVLYAGSDVFNAGSDVLNAGSDVLNAGSDIFNAGADVFNGHYYDQHYNHQYYHDSAGALVGAVEKPEIDRNYPTAAVCRTQRLPWRHGSYTVHVCYGNGPVL